MTLSKTMSSSSEVHGSEWEPSSESDPSSNEEYTSSTSLATSKDTTSSNSTSSQPNNTLQYNFELEEDGIVDIEIWKCKEAYDAIPNQMIICPLGKDALDKYYGVGLDAHPSFKAQLDVLRLKYNEKPLTHYKPRCSSKRAKQKVMEPLEVS